MEILKKIFKIIFKIIKWILNQIIEGGNNAEKRNNQKREARQDYKTMSDEQLLEIIRGDGFLAKSQWRKDIVYGILKERGFNDNDIND